MTDPAPPARTTLTLRDVVTEFCLLGDRVEALEAINKLIRAARAEGRRQALEEAARYITAPFRAPLMMTAAEVLAKEIRRLAEDALKAPKTPEIPAGKQG